MPKKFIGIDIGAADIRLAVAQAAKGGPELIETRTRQIQPGEDIAQALRDAVGETSFGDMVAVALPAVGGFVRTLSFPFSDPKKIDAALSFELDSQIPASIDEMIADFRKPRIRSDGASVHAAAVRREKVAETVRIFADASLPLQTLDLSPFAYVAGLRGRLEDGIFALVDRREAIVCLVRDGQVGDFRSLPLRDETPEDTLLRFLRQETLTLGRAAGIEEPQICLAGAKVDQQLLEALTQSGFTPRIPVLEHQGKTLSADLIPAAALALRAGLPAREREFNFLKGEFAPRSEWAGFRKRLIAAGSLAAAVVLVAGIGTYFSYAQKTARAEALKEEMVSIFQDTFPRVNVIVDVPAQMRSNLNQLRQKTALLGVGRENSALNLMREISANIPGETAIDVRELTYTSDQVRLEGSTGSFDAINRIASTLEKTPSVASAQISDAKMSMDGSRVDFRLTLALAGAKEGS